MKVTCLLRFHGPHGIHECRRIVDLPIPPSIGMRIDFGDCVFPVEEITLGPLRQIGGWLLVCTHIVYTTSGNVQASSEQQLENFSRAVRFAHANGWTAHRIHPDIKYRCPECRKRVQGNLWVDEPDGTAYHLDRNGDETADCVTTIDVLVEQEVRGEAS